MKVELHEQRKVKVVQSSERILAKDQLERRIARLKALIERREAEMKAYQEVLTLIEDQEARDRAAAEKEAS